MLACLRARWCPGLLYRNITSFSSPMLGVMRMQDIAPREASVWFQMGKIYKRLERPDQALQHFCHALDLKPSSGDANLIKAAIEKLRQSDETDEEEM